MAISCDPNDLAQLAKCFKCLPPATLQEVITYLLCQIANNGGTGGGGGVSSIVAGTNINISPAGGTGTVTINATAASTQVFSGNGAPNGVVTAVEPALYYDKVTGILWQKTGGGNTGWN